MRGLFALTLAFVFVFVGVGFGLIPDSGLDARTQDRRPRAEPRQGPAVRNHLAVYYRNCDAARAAGAAPILRGQPGYRPPLDRDNDGIACEPYRGRR